MTGKNFENIFAAKLAGFTSTSTSTCTFTCGSSLLRK